MVLERNILAKRSPFLQYTIGRKVSISVVKLMSSYWISLKRLTLCPMRDYLLSLTSMELEVKCTGGLKLFCQIVNRMFQLIESFPHRDPWFLGFHNALFWVLCFFLFLLLINDLSSSMKSSLRLFADDCVVF